MCIVLLDAGVREAGRTQLVDLADETGPVGYGDGHVAAVDKIEGTGEGPVAFDVVDFEFDVWWDPGVWLEAW